MQNGQTVGEYFYDGEGRRVKKQAYDSGGVVKGNSDLRLFSGKLVAEYSTKPPPQIPTTSDTATDKIGSRRVKKLSQLLIKLLLL